MQISVLLADDHVVLRQGLRSLLVSQQDIRVVGEAGDGIETIRLVEILHPQITVLDLMMPRLNGLEVTRQIFDKTRVLILSMYNNEAYVREALRNGAYGYVLKDVSTDELLQAIRTVSNGKKYLSSPFAEFDIQALLNQGTSETSDSLDLLTNREREILNLIAEGMSTNEISERLSLSSRTIEGHRANLMRKLNLHSLTEVVRYAIKKGLVSLDDTSG
jgi:two-component system, NarL family, response regulator NreC